MDIFAAGVSWCLAVKPCAQQFASPELTVITGAAEGASLVLLCEQRVLRREMRIDLSTIAHVTRGLGLVDQSTH